jgi:hypothetical protein
MSDIALEQQSDLDFTRARSRALVNEIQHFLAPEESSLLSFFEVKRILKPGNEVYLGMTTVPLKSIVGSEGRYSDFDNHFFPKNLHLKKRWQSIDQANLQDISLPAIKLYELGGLYFVRDGNHRVSVAKSKGTEFIDAEVTVLNSEIKLAPGETSLQSLLQQVISYEKRSFYAETAFGDITDCWDMDFSTPGQYDVIYNHINTHRYYCDQQRRLAGLPELTVVEGVRAWYAEVYAPVVNVIQNQRLLAAFIKGRTVSDLYVWLIRYWDDLKQKFGDDYSLEVAAQEFRAEFHESFLTKIRKSFAKITKSACKSKNNDVK